MPQRMSDFHTYSYATGSLTFTWDGLREPIIVYFKGVSRGRCELLIHAPREVKIEAQARERPRVQQK